MKSSIQDYTLSNSTQQAQLEVRNLKVYYFTRKNVVKAVDDVTFELGRGEALGLVGESGCGKTTLGFSLLGLIPNPGKIVDGNIVFKGEDLTRKTEQEMRLIRGGKISMIFQDPTASLNPLLTVGDHLIETIATHKNISKNDACERAKQVLTSLGIASERARDYPHKFSGGMRQRIMIALALCLKPELIIADEITTALDPILQGQILELLKDLARSERGTSWILVTHSMGLVAELCDRAMVMYAGKMVEIARVRSLFTKPLHPYTQGLIKSIPKLEDWKSPLESVAGSPPNLANPPPGCRFHPRCPYAKQICMIREPPLIEAEPGHWVSCFLYG